MDGQPHLKRMKDEIHLGFIKEAAKAERLASNHWERRVVATNCEINQHRLDTILHLQESRLAKPEDWGGVPLVLTVTRLGLELFAWNHIHSMASPEVADTLHMLASDCPVSILGRSEPTWNGVIEDLASRHLRCFASQGWRPAVHKSVVELGAELKVSLWAESPTIDLAIRHGLSCRDWFADIPEGDAIPPGSLTSLFYKFGETGFSSPDEDSSRLDEVDRKILDAMRRMGAVSKETRQTQDEIAAEAIDPLATGEAIKQRMSRLVKAGFVASKKHRGGGSWLTELGKKQ